MGWGSPGAHFAKAYQAVPAMLCVRMQSVDPWDSPMAAQIGKEDSFPGSECLIQAFLRDLLRPDIFVYLYPGSQTIKTHLLWWKIGE